MSPSPFPVGTLSARALRGALSGPFDLDLDPGHCTVLSGPSGIGKSLLLRMIADLDPNQGVVSLGGVSRESQPAHVWRRWVTYVPAESGWWEDDVAAHFADPDGARRLLPQVNLDPALLRAQVTQLSTGERQRLALVRALLQQPHFLLLDEPTAALDPDNREHVERLLLAAKAQGMGLLVVTHDAEQARRLGERQLHLDHDGLTELHP
ncbi:ATP-binding cassette domain-containing protein [Pseudomonas sp. GD04087]|uniref:ABC transporter ATP-binding protein n=1 Tax=unclassified Pseudomonas TaxID=196821 RepID=UPI002447036D|nr:MULTISPECIES: ABC transporter ATP-binding protein [unclassified Pseudomonas]MDH0289058.1 ATP-binding cassette domain-containing protein [Pseudomonas sp. GD04087]MDH1048410.1 ATP-binding cassette domain-containing protein [Pseudomonas sp. GD03903]MDH1997932.1 ATP-binding cassette domain-containing protein [Pseudomonas sp. GD03691]